MSDLDTQIQGEPVVETVVADIEPPTMDDTIRNTLAEIESRGETEEQTAERVRDQQGRFARQEAAPIVEPAAPVVEAPVPPDLQKLGLRKEEFDQISKQPPEVQAMLKATLERRFDETRKGVEGLQAKAQLGAEFEQTMQPYMATIQSLGVTPAVAVQKLMAADHSLRYGTPQQKQNMLATIARDYGIAAPSGAAQGEQQPESELVQQLQAQIQQLQGWMQQQNQSKEWEQSQTLNSAIEKFSANPSNAYFNDVRTHMSGLLQSGAATTLEDAYEQAIYANPTIRAKVIAEQQAKAEVERKANALKVAQAAKAAAGANVPRRGSLPAAKPIGTMEDTIRQEAERLGLMS